MALHVHEDAAQPVFDRERLEQLLALEGLNVEMPRNQIRQSARIAHALKDLLHDFGRQARLLTQLRGALAHLAMQRYERGILLIQWSEIGRFPNGRFEIAVGLGVMDSGAASVAMHDQLHAPQIALHLADTRNCPGRVKNTRRDLIDVFFLGDREDFAVGILQDVFYALRVAFDGGGAVAVAANAEPVLARDFHQVGGFIQSAGEVFIFHG